MNASGKCVPVLSVVALLFCLALVLPRPAMAQGFNFGCQQAPGGSCQVQNDLRSSHLILWTHQAAAAVRETLAARYFGSAGRSPMPGVVEALGYADTGSQDDSTDGAFAAFDAPAQPVTPLWDAWGNPSGTYSDRGSSTDGFKGVMGQLSAGFDRQLGGGAVLGGFVSANSSHYDTTTVYGAGTTGASGSAVGAYAGMLFGDKVFGTVTAQYGWTDNSFATGGSRADYASRSLGLTGSLTGYFQSGQIRFSPLATISYAREWQDGYTETSGAVSPERATETGVVSVGFESGYTLPIAAGQSVEPWAGASLDWTYLNRTTPTPPASADPIASVDVKLSGGVNLAFSDAVSLNLRTDISGLTTPDYIVAGFGGQLTGRF